MLTRDRIPAAAAGIQVEVSPTLPELSWAWEATVAPAASPFVGPTFLRAQQPHAPTLAPHHLVAHLPDGQTAMLPAYLLQQPDRPDFDPRTYLGWRPASGERACCETTRPTDAAQPGHPNGEPSPLADLPGLAPVLADVDRFYPVLLLGSVDGYKTELTAPATNPGLADALAERLVDGALAEAARVGARIVLAPWVAERASGVELRQALARRSAIEAFWALENYLPLPHGSMAGHMAALPNRRRYRFRQDQQAAAGAGVTVRYLEPAELPAYLPRIGELVASNRQRYGARASAEELAPVVTTLLDAGVPMVCPAGFLNGELVACCLLVGKAERLYARYAGFDYDRLGQRSGAYFAVVMHATIAAAYQHGYTQLEYGIGAHQAKALRGCASRPVTSHLLVVDDPTLAAALAPLAETSSQRRLADYQQPDPTPTSPPGATPASPCTPASTCAPESTCTPATANDGTACSG